MNPENKKPAVSFFKHQTYHIKLLLNITQYPLLNINQLNISPNKKNMDEFVGKLGFISFHII